MRGPTTEVLNEDLKEIKAEIRDTRDDLGVLETDVHNMAIAAVQDRETLSLFKWAGSMMVGIVFGTGLAGVAWVASFTTNGSMMESRHVEKFPEAGVRIDKLESSIDRRFEEVITRIDKLESRLDARLDKFEASIVKALNQGKPGVPAGPPVAN